MAHNRAKQRESDEATTADDNQFMDAPTHAPLVADCPYVASITKGNKTCRIVPSICRRGVGHGLRGDGKPSCGAVPDFAALIRAGPKTPMAGTKPGHDHRSPTPDAALSGSALPVKLNITGLEGHVDDELRSGRRIAGFALIRLSGRQKRADR